MQPDQFDKLGGLVERLIDDNRQKRFENVKLKNEIDTLIVKVDQFKSLPENFNSADVKRILDENKILKNKNLEIKMRLNKLISKLEYNYSS